MGDVVQVMGLISEDPDNVNECRDSWGNTPLHRACRFGHVDVVTYLLDHGSHINQRIISVPISRDNGATALYLACMGGNHSVVHLLLERGADPTFCTSFGTTALMAASTSETQSVWQASWVTR